MPPPPPPLADLRRLYGQEGEGESTIDFESEGLRIAPAGHVVAVRITAGVKGACGERGRGNGWVGRRVGVCLWCCGVGGWGAWGWAPAHACPRTRCLLTSRAAPPCPTLPPENANDGFKPTSGGIEEISFRSTPEVGARGLRRPALPATTLHGRPVSEAASVPFGRRAWASAALQTAVLPSHPSCSPTPPPGQVWGYFSVKGGGAIHEYSDSQFGHLFAKGETREAAIRAMVVALKEIKIR